jgi:hypothetical protein
MSLNIETGAHSDTQQESHQKQKHDKGKNLENHGKLGFRAKDCSTNEHDKQKNTGPGKAS